MISSEAEVDLAEEQRPRGIEVPPPDVTLTPHCETKFSTSLLSLAAIIITPRSSSRQSSRRQPLM